MSARRPGRRPATTSGELERLALALFSERGFDETTVEDVAAAAGISRRTFFHYFESKNDLVWGDFDAQLARLRQRLAAAPPELAMMDALRREIVSFNTFDPAVLESHRQRMRLILEVPQLQAHSTLRYAAWRQVVAEFVAHRCGQRPADLVPRLLGHLLLACAITAYECWLAEPGSELASLVDSAIAALGSPSWR